MAIKNNVRNTPIRKGLLKILSQNKAPLSAFDILAKLSNQKLDVNKTTVYRQLALLEKQDLIHAVRLSDRSVRYELTEQDNHHHHLVCVKCNNVKDIDFKDRLDQQEKIIQKNNKFKIFRHSLEFFGLCFNCQ
jgi:Fe2+ or Zn2+ uptake regulation protein